MKAGTLVRRPRPARAVPQDVEFATKTQLDAAMVTSAVAGGTPFAWIAGDEVCGRASTLRRLARHRQAPPQARPAPRQPKEALM